MKKFILLLITLLLFTGCSSKKETTTFEHLSDFSGHKVASILGSSYNQALIEGIDGVEVEYASNLSEQVMFLKTHKVDGLITDNVIAYSLIKDDKSLSLINEPFFYFDIAYMFSPQKEDVRLQFNEFLANCNKSGYIDELDKKWNSTDGTGSQQKKEKYELTGENGVLKVLSPLESPPFSYLSNNEPQGYEVELLEKFANEYGYGIELTSCNFETVIPSISTGKYDIAYSVISVTEERKKQVNFSDSIYKGFGLIIINNSEASEKQDFIDTITNKFYATFIEEDRWKIILSGALTTLLIAISSTIIGTIIGFILYLIYRKAYEFMKKIIDFLEYIINGLPVVVILMILFYIVFNKSKISGTIIAIIGFSTIICFSTFGLLKTGVGAIEKGQMEGALALGYSENKALYKFVLPQALKIVMPSYCGEIVSLVKSTSIVGYVTVQDLTRASDIIRSRTYDAFFPLIVTAIIYFLMSSLLIKFITRIQNKCFGFERSKEEILKRVKD